MAHLLLFHHIQGLTEGVAAFADAVRAAGHRVTTPDLFDGRTFGSIEEGSAYAKTVDTDAAGIAVAEGLEEDLVYGGFSMGIMLAQQLAQQRRGARGALLYHGAIPLGHFGDAWPEGVPLQVHMMREDPFESVDDARELVQQAEGELFVYEGDAHLFTDRTLEAYDAAATKLVLERTLAFLDALP